MTHEKTQTASAKYPLVALRDLITFGPRRTGIEPRPSTPVGYVTMAGIFADNVTATPVRCRMTAVPIRAVQFHEGDLLVPRKLIELKSNKVALAPTLQTPGFCAATLYVIRCDAARLDVHYLLHFLRQQNLGHLVDAFLKDETGVHPPVRDFFNNLVLALPSLSEQRHIASELHGMSQLAAAQCVMAIETKPEPEQAYDAMNLLSRVAIRTQIHLFA